MHHLGDWFWLLLYFRFSIDVLSRSYSLLEASGKIRYKVSKKCTEIMTYTDVSWVYGFYWEQVISRVNQLTLRYLNSSLPLIMQVPRAVQSEWCWWNLFRMKMDICFHTEIFLYPILKLFEHFIFRRLISSVSPNFA